MREATGRCFSPYNRIKVEINNKQILEKYLEVNHMSLFFNCSQLAKHFIDFIDLFIHREGGGRETERERSIRV